MPPASEFLRFEILGPMRAWRSTTELDLGVPQQRALLGLLLIRTGEHLRLSEIVDVLWAERPPATAVNVVHRYVGLLRRLLEPELPPRAPGSLLLREAGGYRLLVAPDSVDLLRHRDLAHRARQAADGGRLDAALELFADALALWRGPVATGVPEQVRSHPVFGGVDRAYLDSVAEAADVALRCARAERVVGLLRQAVALDPLNEPLHARLVLALAASGHRAQALAVYDAIHTRLAEDLDVPPGPELREAHRQVTTPTTRETTPGGARPPWVRPAQLPTDLPVFAGRHAELTQLLDLLPPSGQSGGTGQSTGTGQPTGSGQCGGTEQSGGAVRFTGPAQSAGAGQAGGPGQPTGAGKQPTRARQTGGTGQPTGSGQPTGRRQTGGTGQPTGAGQPTGSGQCGGTEQSGGAVRFTGSVQPAGAGQTGGTGQPTGSAQPTGRQPIGSEQSTGTRQPTGSGQSGGAGQATAAGQYGGTEQYGGAVRFTDSAQPTGAGQSTGTGQPTDPVLPTDATQPTGPGQPAGAPQTHTATIVVISGMAGVGKSSLAVHWAHRIAERFPDGQLYLNLRGFDPGGSPTQPAEAIAGMLHALGVPPQHLPTGLDAQAALYRSLLADRRVLVLLDNARDHDQVRPLLPGSPGCLALVTSRSQLPGLVASDGAVPVLLRLPPVEDARASLVRRIGQERAAAEPRAVADIIELCGRLPLALAIVAARAALHPGFPLAAVATELRRSHGSLDAFADTGSAIDARAAFSWSYDALTPESARAFRLLALHPGPDLTAAAAASLTGLPVRRTRTLLAELTRAHLLTEHSWGRYTFHDLVRAYATELVEDHDTDATRRSALHRMLDHYVHTAHPAALLLSPDADLIPPGPALPGVTPETLTDDRQALDWLTAEYTGLLPAMERAAVSGFDAHLCHLAWALEAFFDRRGHWHDWHTAQRAALEAAHRLADPEWQAFAQRSLARVDGRLGHYAEARTGLDRAAEAFDRLGDTVRLANTHRSLGWTSDQQGDLTAALAHNQRALELFRAAGRRAAEARVLNAVGWYLSLLGRYDQALTHCEQALVMMRETGDRYGEAATWDSIGHAHHHLGQYKQAVIGFHNALTVYRELGVPYQEADTLTRLGDTRQATGEQAAARQSWQQALTLFTELGRPDEAEGVRARMRDRDRERGLA
ncbi:BTAD domain-containing putative transcriptional regulator [Streptomyces sp. RTd22]|uniref:BTAD domain-containing putative transcriptional regulator n=1 Tax=Streptomyces sp. RTd22 TaxID=1841249 RepID=UPI0007C52AA3|nr:BTAD domain-containing putative transcriptional regulator [Streptomyces sp. RTd22]